jgi:hypothetical protein
MPWKWNDASLPFMKRALPLNEEPSRCLPPEAPVGLVHNPVRGLLAVCDPKRTSDSGGRGSERS